MGFILPGKLTVRTLSTSHLYSSAFVVDKEYEEKGHKEDKIPSRFILTGAGWGHGVGPVSYTHLDVYKRQPSK